MPKKEKSGSLGASSDNISSTPDINATILPGRVIEYFIKQHYPKEVEELKADTLKDGHKNSLTVDYINLVGNLEDNGHKGLFKNNPNGVIETANNVLNNITGKEYATIILEEVPYNVYLRALEAKHVGDFISTNAMVKSVSPIKTRIIKATFECKDCYKQEKVLQKSKVIEFPTFCEMCGGKKFRLLTDESEFINRQVLKLEEPLELRKDGTTREFKAIIEGDIVNPVKKIIPGEVVHIAGFFRNEYDDKAKEWNFYLELNNITPIDKTFQDIEVTEDDIEQIEALAGQPDLMEKLKKAVAPNIHGHDEVKEGLVLQLFSGDSGNDGNNSLKRSIIHVLLIGDPGIAKSEILKNVAKLSPKGITVNGAGATKAGLMGAAVKDDITGKWTIEAGALPLADQGLICIDELDKMGKEVVLALNEPMEQQTVTETKAGLNVTMTARTPVLAAANPKFERFRIDKTIKSQITVPPTTFSRFDLIYALEDRTNYDNDLELAGHLLKDEIETEQDIIEPELIRTYVAYAKREFMPKLVEKAKEVLKVFYAKTRKAAAENEDAKPITGRDLMALQRLTITMARIHLRDYATEQDAKEAIRIYSDSLSTLGLEPETAGELIGDKSQKEMQQLTKAETIVKSYYDDYGAMIPAEAIKDAINELMISCDLDEPTATEVYRDTLSSLDSNN